MEYVKTEHSHVIKCKPEDIDCIVYEKGMSNKSIKEPFAVNGTFFSWEGGSGKYFSTSPLVVNGKAHRWGSNHGKPQSCFIIWKDNSVTMQRVNNISEIELNKVKYIFGGVGLINKLSPFKYDPASEGFSGKFSDVLRRTNKTVLAYRKSDNAMMVFTIENKTHDEVIKILESHTIDVACALDGGGSTFMNANGVRVKGDGRKVANAIVVKGVNETKPQSPSQEKMCLDYGHRNNSLDYGATNGSVKESALALQIGKKIKSQLEKNNVTVIETRKSEDETVSLNDRCKIANSNKCDFFLSIHINAAENVSAKGVEVLHYKGNDNKINAQKMSDAICKHTKAANRGAKERNDLAVLRGTSMKALLVECGFLSNIEEFTKLQDEKYQNLMVRGIIESLGYVYVEDKPVEPPKEDNKLYRVCVGSYSDKANADKMMTELVGKGYKPFIAVYEK